MDNFIVPRDYYLGRLIEFKDNGMPKVITGIRRCGKSFLLKEIYKNYLLSIGVSESNILVVELDDDRNIDLRNPLELGKYVRSFSLKDKSKTNYVFIDEIQKVKTVKNPYFNDKEVINSDLDTISFVDVILGLSREKNIDLYVTGSNSKMLSSDIITEFRDKAVNIEISPFSFCEYSNYKNDKSSDFLYEYMLYGGMPRVVGLSDDEKKSYLKNLFKTTYFADIIERNKIYKNENLDEVCSLISTCTGQLISPQKIANTFESVKKDKINSQTVAKYIDFFIDSFLIREAKRYDLKGRKEIGALRKYYFTDLGLRNSIVDFIYTDEGQLLENIVYNELKFNKYDVRIGSFDSVEKKDNMSIRKTYEVDFYATKGRNRFYIQVANDLSNVETKMREIRPFILLNSQVRKVIVVNKPIRETFDENGFTIIGAVDFLLRFIK